jgi:glycosyltransferase involved in cell wall biosynthesis
VKETAMAKVDIVIPCYNYDRFLEGCVNSVLSQSISDIRILIIDDASSDDSKTVAESLAAADPRVSFISHSQNIGHIRTYNQGIDWLESDYFLLLSADDLLVPGSLERASRIMDEYPDIVLTYGRGIEWFDDTPFPTQISAGDERWSRQDLIQDMCASAANLVTTPTAIVRASAQKSVGGYEIDLPHSADMAMWLKFSAVGSIAQIHATQAIYRRHSSNMSASYYAEKLSDYLQRKAAFDNFFRTARKLPPNAVTLQAQANRKLAEKAYWTGVGQLLRGRALNAGALLRFATNLDPQLYYRPPFQQLLQTPRLGKVLASIASEAASRHLSCSKRL